MRVINVPNVKFGEITGFESGKTAIIKVGKSDRLLKPALTLDLGNRRRVCMVGIEQTMWWLSGHSDCQQVALNDEVAFEVYLDENGIETTVWAPWDEYNHVHAIAECTQRHIITLDSQEKWVGVYNRELRQRVDIEGTFPRFPNGRHRISSLERGALTEPKLLRDSTDLYYLLKNAEVLRPKQRQRGTSGRHAM